MTSAKFYQDMEKIYNRFNKQLFDGLLPDCMITLERSKKFAGYHVSGSFRDLKSKDYDQICLNPELFLEKTTEQVLSTLVHEMCHVWQAHFGKPSRAGYHNAEWVRKMKEVGLNPVSLTTGEKGTGQKVTHTIAPDGKFKLQFDIMGKQAEIIDFKAVYFTDKEKKKAKEKAVYECDECGMKVWGKPGLHVVCGSCDITCKCTTSQPEDDGE